MKKLITLIAIVSLGFTATAQKAVTLIQFGTSDSISVMEQDIYKVDNEAGDSTATVEYLFRGATAKMVADTNQTEFAARTNRLVAPSGVGYMINVDRIQGMGRLTDSTCYVFYLKGNQRIKLELTVPLSSFQGTINGL